MEQQSPSLYPNPATQQIRLALPSTSSYRFVSVVDMQGRVVLPLSAIPTSMSIDIANLSEGIYLLRLAGSFTMPPAVLRFIKQ